MLVIVDYGMGNTASIKNMLKRIGIDSIITNSPEEIKDAKKIILPGVGAFDAAIIKIENLDLKEIIINRVKIDKIPILGICLGMQILFEKSDEGNKSGLSLMQGKVKKFDERYDIKVPHMGWNDININKKNELINNLGKGARFYFCHSYYVKMNNQTQSIANTYHGITFDSIINFENIYGVQFHPEKSHKYGMELLNNFGKIEC